VVENHLLSLQLHETIKYPGDDISYSVSDFPAQNFTDSALIIPHLINVSVQCGDVLISDFTRTQNVLEGIH